VKIHFSNVNFSSRSGPNTFGTRLAKQFLKMGHEVVDHNEAYDVFLAFIEPATKPRSGSKFIHRLDGIWFKPDQFHTHNKGIKLAYDNADKCIWISEFNRSMSAHYWGEKPGSVINNGIELIEVKILDEQIKNLRNKYNKIFVSSANWHRQKRLKENIECFKLLQEKNNNSCLLIMGSHPDHVVNDPNIFYTNNLPHDLCLQVFSAADWMIHLAWLDHCPNAVVEGMSQKCGIICASSGGTKEAVGKNGIVVEENEEYKYQLADYDNPPQIDFSNIILPENIEIDNSILDIKTIAEKYLETIESV
tara:strand:- start:1354 stop:2268 length:915 start_codon:yes stop_codon:yes gene_type:complete